MAGDHLLLQKHAAFLFAFDDDARVKRFSHAWLHRRMESENVPACSRMTANWPVSSEYLNCVWGMPSRSSFAMSMGCSSGAGSQKLGAQKMTPSARLRRTDSTSACPCSPSGR